MIDDKFELSNISENSTPLLDDFYLDTKENSVRLTQSKDVVSITTFCNGFINRYIEYESGKIEMPEIIKDDFLVNMIAQDLAFIDIVQINSATLMSIYYHHHKSFGVKALMIGHYSFSDIFVTILSKMVWLKLGKGKKDEDCNSSR